MKKAPPLLLHWIEQGMHARQLTSSLAARLLASMRQAERWLAGKICSKDSVFS
jgi:hypothetical protein